MIEKTFEYPPKKDEPINLPDLVHLHNLKAGDKVICTHGWKGIFREGSSYTLEQRGEKCLGLGLTSVSSPLKYKGDGWGVGFLPHTSEDVDPYEDLIGLIVHRGGTARYRIDQGSSYLDDLQIVHLGSLGVPTDHYSEKNVRRYLKSGTWEIANENESNTTTLKQENTMSNNNRYLKVAVATPTLIFGHNIEDFTVEEYLDAIRKINRQIESYSDIKNCDRVEKIVEQLRVDLAHVIKIFNESE